MKCKTCGKMDCYAHGGSVDEGPSEKANQMGVNKIAPNYDRAHNEVKHGQSEARYGDKKAAHGQTLQELRSMPSPKLQGLADGGEVEPADDMAGVDDELMDMACEEFCEAVHKKDKKGILEALRAIVLSMGE